MVAVTETDTLLTKEQPVAAPAGKFFNDGFIQQQHQIFGLGVADEVTATQVGKIIFDLVGKLTHEPEDDNTLIQLARSLNEQIGKCTDEESVYAQALKALSVNIKNYINEQTSSSLAQDYSAALQQIQGEQSMLLIFLDVVPCCVLAMLCRIQLLQWY